MSEQIKIFDTTLRDGEQSPGFSMNLEEKLRLALQLERLQVDVIEAGFPIASEGDFLAVKEIASRIKKCSVAALCRTKITDIDRAWGSLKYAQFPRLHIFIATSDLHLKFKLKKSHDEVISDIGEAVKYAKSLCKDVEFSAEDASRSDKDFLCEVFSVAIEAGVTVINVPDTVGYSVPWEFGKLIRYIKRNVTGIENVVLSVHCHNDLGLGGANSLAGIQNGARQIECTINGIGERAGNTSLEEIVMTLKTRKKYFDFYTGINTEEIYRTSRLLAEVTGIDVQPNKAIVGKNAFAHEAGIHQDGVLKNPLTYEIMTPQSVGVSSNSLVIGKHSGRHAINVKLQEYGFNVEDDMLLEIYIEVMELADTKKEITDDDILSITDELIMSRKEAVGM